MVFLILASSTKQTNEQINKQKDLEMEYQKLHTQDRGYTKKGKHTYKLKTHPHIFLFVSYNALFYSLLIFVSFEWLYIVLLCSVRIVSLYVQYSWKWWLLVILKMM